MVTGGDWWWLVVTGGDWWQYWGNAGAGRHARLEQGRGRAGAA